MPFAARNQNDPARSDRDLLSSDTSTFVEMRHRIERSLHDGAGQTLTTLSFLLHILKRELTKQQSDQVTRVMEIQQLLDQALGQIHELSKDLTSESRDETP